MNKISKEQLKRVKHDWQTIAGEELKLGTFGNCIIDAFGSELATLKLLKAYRYSKKATQIFSKNLKTFVFTLELEL